MQSHHFKDMGKKIYNSIHHPILTKQEDSRKVWFLGNSWLHICSKKCFSFAEMVIQVESWSIKTIILLSGSDCS